VGAVVSTEVFGDGVWGVSRLSFLFRAGVDPAEVERLLGAEIELEEGLATIRTANPQRSLLSLTGWAEERGVVLEELQAIRPTLEDMFLELTAESESGAEPQEALS
jgi:hypothetical protein